MKTIQGPQRRTTSQALQSRYPTRLQLRYKATSKRGPIQGFDQTTMMSSQDSSQDIIFAPGDRLEPGMAAEIVLAWPFLLDNRIRLQLVLQVMITGSQDGVAEARILAYHSTPPGRGADPAGMKNKSPAPDAASLLPRERKPRISGRAAHLFPTPGLIGARSYER